MIAFHPILVAATLLLISAVALVVSALLIHFGKPRSLRILISAGVVLPWELTLLWPGVGSVSRRPWPWPG